MNRRLRTLLDRGSSQPWYIAIGGIAIFIILMLLNGGISKNLLQIGLDSLLCLGGFVFWMIFFSQFVLPVRTLKERALSFSRVWNYFFGAHGPALMVENGEVKKRKGEMQRKGPGVILLDAASAAVLRTPTHITRAVGPGIVFTNHNETIAGTVDLHIQNQKIGPWQGEDPFAPQQDGETQAAFETRQKRRRETQALTRDGIEVVPEISVTFRLNVLPGVGRTEFGYDGNAVMLAIIGRSIDLSNPDESSDRLLSWRWLPPYLAADIWRELLSKFTMAELFQTSPDQPGALELIKELMRDRMCARLARQLDDFGHPTGEMVESKEYDLLTKRGLKVIGVSISNLRFPEEVEEQLVKRWKASWLKRAYQERDLVERERGRVEEFGRTLGLQQYVELISRPVASLATVKDLNGRQILQHLIQGTLDLVNHDPHLQNATHEELRQLEELLEWVEREGEAA